MGEISLVRTQNARISKREIYANNQKFRHVDTGYRDLGYPNTTVFSSEVRHFVLLITSDPHLS